jgi:SWI/SNF-related matrix-associated actin-dependent regulator of chromatin subfamily A3
VDRIHRLGQKRPVEIIRMLMKGSVEERIMELQNKKREMMNAALSNKQSREKIKEERLSELSILFR